MVGGKDVLQSTHLPDQFIKMSSAVDVRFLTGTP
jgi:hypothetical protein